MYWLKSKSKLKSIINEKDDKIKELEDQLIIEKFRFENAGDLKKIKPGFHLNDEIIVSNYDITLEKRYKYFWIFRYKAFIPKIIINCIDLKNEKNVSLNIEEVKTLHLHFFSKKF